ncbi:glycosyltransferase [Paenibacillus alkaliterrae]|uniref:glycosyltransferase n=1 Tax=Paenibacillus alkaliterrae TaxID=320909 RepID=UPI001F437DC9|nr:glycosyltransferase [Paenibacillus alkaliterrae]MCF2940164.1 glycosyltransferase [Paenibacillus alkaliterrae]
MSGSRGQRLSLVMIARDEQLNIGRALRSVKDIVDEMIVVDTGSVDDTVEIAEALGAQVFYFPWQNDFSLAKNVAIEHATGDWMLLMDADDELHPEDRHLVRELLLENDTDCFFFDTLSYFGEGGGLYVRMLQPRLVKNNPRFRFTGKIHETLQLNGVRINYCDIRVQHYGYLNTEVEAKKKISRNRTLLEDELAQNPTAITYFYLGTEHLRAGDYDLAVETFERSQQLYLEMGVVPSSEMLKKKIIAFQELCQYKRVYEQLEEAIRLYPDYTDLYFLRAETLEQEGKIIEAIKAYHACTQQGEAPVTYSSMCGSGSYTAYYRIGYLYSEIGESDKALEAYFDALQCNTSYVPAVHAIADELVKSKSNDEILTLLGRQFDLNIPIANQYFAEAFSNAGAFDTALVFLHQYEQLSPSLPEELHLLKAQCLFYSGELQQAYDMFNQIPAESRKFVRASFFKCIYYWLRGDYAESLNTLHLLRQANRFAPYEIELCEKVSRILEEKSEYGRPAAWILSDKEEEALLGLAEIFVYLGKYEWIAKIYTFIPKQWQHEEKLILFAKLLLKKGNATEAERWARLWDDRGNPSLESAVLMAEIAYSFGRYDQAWKGYQEVLHKSPDHIMAILGLSRISYQYYLETAGLDLHSATPKPNQDGISLCMIVKNEEEHLPAALQSISGLVDEIIIVDTGSEDDTVMIAEQHRAKIFRVGWNDDFSLARNTALEQAASTWILVLDADEWLDPECCDRLRELIQNSDIDGYFLTIKSKIDDTHTIVDRRLSLFRNKPEYRYEGIIHESIPLQRFWEQGNRIETVDIVIHHGGYKTEVIEKKQKSRRNMSIIRKQLQQQESPLYRYYLGVEFMLQNQCLEAANHFQASLSDWTPEHPQYADCLNKLAHSYLALKEYEACEKILSDGITRFPDFTDLHHIFATCAFEQGRWKQAIEHFEACIAMGPAPYLYSSFEGVATYHTYYGLGLAHREAEQWERSTHYFMLALDCNPRYIQASQQLIQNWRTRYGIALQYAKEALQLGIQFHPESNRLREKLSRL